MTLLLLCNGGKGWQLRYKHPFKSSFWFYCLSRGDAMTFLTAKLSIILSKQLTQKLLNSVKVRGLIGFICNVFEKLIKAPHTAEETGNTIFSFSRHDHSEHKWREKDKVDVETSLAGGKYFLKEIKLKILLLWQKTLLLFIQWMYSASALYSHYSRYCIFSVEQNRYGLSLFLLFLD